MKTIKQIADEIGVSKTAVRKKITGEVKTKFAETVSGVIYISEQGEALIKSAFNKNQPQTKFAEVSGNQTANQPETFPEVSGTVSALISMLQTELEIKNKELETKNKQLEVKDKQIEELTATIRIQAESINAAHHNELAETIIDSRAAPKLPETNNQKRPFWQFWKK